MFFKSVKYMPPRKKICRVFFAARSGKLILRGKTREKRKKEGKTKI